MTKALQQARVFLLGGVADQSKGVDDGVRLASHMEYLRGREMADVVVAIADDIRSAWVAYGRRLKSPRERLPLLGRIYTYDPSLLGVLLRWEQSDG